MRDARAFAAFLGDAPVTKEAAIRYKEHLSKRYAVSSANSMLAAVNSLPRVTKTLPAVIPASRTYRFSSRHKSSGRITVRVFPFRDTAARLLWREDTVM